MTDSPNPLPTSRHSFVVVLRFMGIALLSWFAFNLGMSFLASDALNTLNDQIVNGTFNVTSDDYSPEVTAALQDITRASLLMLIPTMVIHGWLFTRVAYRWLDGILTIIPIVNIWFITKLYWRLANLPYRYWAKNEERVE